MEEWVFCKIGSGEIQGLRICEDDEALAFMDIAKDYDGHILVIPKKHYRYVTDCPDNLACMPGESQGQGAWWAAVCGVAQSQTRLKRLSSSSRAINTLLSLSLFKQSRISK